MREMSSGHIVKHFEILDVIARGELSNVYRATDTKLGRDVVIYIY